MTQYNFKHYIAHGDSRHNSYDNKFLLCDAIGWNNLTYDNVCKSELVMANDFFGYQFKRKPNQHTLWDLACQRWQDLRNKYDYIRFWYSGGKDSHFAYMSARHAGVKFDEILCHKPGTFYSEESDQLFKVLDATKWTMEPEYYDMVYKDPDWWKWASVWSIQAAIEPNMIARYVLPNITELSTPDNYCEVIGGETPRIWYEDNWKFCFDEKQCTGHTHNNIQNFLITEDLPELYEAYVNSICDGLEQVDMKLNWEQTLKETFGSRRQLRDMSPIFKDLNSSVNLYSKQTDISSDFYAHEPWARYHFSIKDCLHIQQCYGTDKEYYLNYCKSPWDKINTMWDWGTIVSKTFVLDTE